MTAFMSSPQGPVVLFLQSGPHPVPEPLPKPVALPQCDRFWTERYRDCSNRQHRGNPILSFSVVPRQLPYACFELIKRMRGCDKVQGCPVASGWLPDTGFPLLADVPAYDRQIPVPGEYP